MTRSLRMPRPALLLLAAALLPACPVEGDDDDSSDQPPDIDFICDTDPEFNRPVIDAVDLCEVPGTAASCEGAGVQGGFETEFRVTVSDVDGDLSNPRYLLGLVNFPPYSNGRLEGDLGGGGVLRILIPCNRWTRGEVVDWSIEIQDSYGCWSEPETGTWQVPAREGDDDCPAPVPG